jgi:putative oxygen-independent coproporphyrinogen III oxidase
VSAGLYVHVPFCVTRCGYCDFNAYAGLGHLRSRYVAALVREAELAAPDWSCEPFASVFLGGGTPTTLEPADLRALLARLRSMVDVSSDAEITIEANPDTVDRTKLSALLDAGYTRLSMGAQSFDRTVLESLERLHDPDSVRRAMHAAREADYANVNLDLIYGANGETLESWERTLRVTVDLQPEHVSAYALTIEQSTPLGRKVQRGVVPAPDADLQADMFELACEVLGEAGFHHYEVSNWACEPRFECRHNLGYWRKQPYLGLGAGAHSYRDGRRWWNVRPPEEYLSLVESGRLPIGGEEHLTPQEEDLEEVFLKLRTLEGIPIGSVASGVAVGFLEQGLLSMVGDHLVPTERGMFLLNELVLGLAS